ncbi:MAG TPA: ankyrin repeat domain-containing protein [Steroidobacteraceae bacterium]|nr:ankyrin repeat domain-containing protein [Steroidobacteraceae bacterium]
MRQAVAAAVAAALLLGSATALADVKDVNARQPDGSTPLQWAAFEGDVAEAKRLIAAGADVNATNNYGINAMLLAADIASTELIQLLLKHGVDPNTSNADGETPLHLVARAGNIEAAQALLKAGAKVDPREKFGDQTPLMWAVVRRHPAMADFLLEQGADVNARSAIRDYQRVATAESRAKSLDRGGFTPLIYAARENCRECIDVLLRHGADVNLPDPTGVVPMVIAMINGNTDIAKRLIEAGADVNQWDIYGQAPLHVAIANMSGGRGGNPLDADQPQQATGAELVQMLIERGANPNQQTYLRPAVRGGGGRGTTPFLVAVGTGNLDLVKQLVAKGANVRLSTSEGTGAIHAAVQARSGGGGGGGGFGAGGPPPGGGGPPAGDAPAAGAGDGGAAPGGEPGAPAAAPRAAAPVAGTASLMGAAPPRGGAPGAGGAPAARGAGPGTGGPRPNPQVELVKYLVEQGADLHLVAQRHFLNRSRGGSALHYAVRGGGNRQVIQALVELGLDINVKDEDGLTALDYAMARGYVPFLQMPSQPNKSLADFLRSLGATVELQTIPDWPPQGPPIATAVYDSVIWPVDPVGP